MVHQNIRFLVSSETLLKTEKPFKKVTWFAGILFKSSAVLWTNNLTRPKLKIPEDCVNRGLWRGENPDIQRKVQRVVSDVLGQLILEYSIEGEWSHSHEEKSSQYLVYLGP